MARIGVYVCHCGINIAATVDCEAVAEYAAALPGVVVAETYKYMCSDPGQRLIVNAIEEHNLTGVVVAACSPRMHETTFRRTVEKAGFNPYMLEVANIREHCSWVHKDRQEATEKAKDLVRMMVERVKRNIALSQIEMPVNQRALVVGAGISGIQAALDIAAAGYEVALVERKPSIGGHMAMLGETFPTLDCSQCILTPRMVEVVQNEKITLHTYAEIDTVDGYVGNFKVKVRKKARSVDMDKCTGCGDCWNKCPAKKIPNEHNCLLDNRTAVYIPFPQAVPNVPVIDRENCIYFKTGKCGICKKVCTREAVDYDMEDEIVEEDVGAIVVATGYKPLDPQVYEDYGYGKYPDVVTSLEFERMLSASGPTGGKLQRPSDGSVPKTVAFLQCIGSRREVNGKEYCSKICCMYTAKHAILYKHCVHDGQSFIFYMDIRSAGKNYEEFVRKTVKGKEVTYIRGRVAKIFPQGDKLLVRGEDTLSGEQVEIAADLVVLATATEPAPGVLDLAQKLRIGYDQNSFLSEAHPKLRPVETNTAGIFLAGACQAPKDIPDCVAQASGAASKVLGLISRDNLLREPTIAVVDELTCNGCFECINTCAYNAIERKEVKDRDGNVIGYVAYINEGLCQGCGACAVTCRSKCIEVRGSSDNQLFAAINAIPGDEDESEQGQE